MMHFLDAYNGGDQNRLRHFFPAKAELQTWLYSMSRGGAQGKTEVGTDNRKKLLKYFADRHEQHDQMWLLSVKVTPSNSSSASRPNIDIVYSLARRADDLKPGPAGAKRPTIGKSVVDCKRQEIMLTSLETLPTKPKNTFASNRQCPEPADRHHNNVIVACTGR